MNYLEMVLNQIVIVDPILKQLQLTVTMFQFLLKRNHRSHQKIVLVFSHQIQLIIIVHVHQQLDQFNLIVVLKQLSIIIIIIILKLNQRHHQYNEMVKNQRMILVQHIHRLKMVYLMM
jgi:hypothetical protein